MKKITAITLNALLFLSAGTAAFAQATPTPLITFSIQRPPNLNITDPGKLLGALIGLMLILAVVAALIYLLWGGLQWIISGGDKAGVEAAQHKIQAALLGLLIVFSVWALFTLVGKFLGIPDIFSLSIPSPF